MTSVPDLVRISRLETQFYSNPECIQHVKYESTISTNQRSVRKEEKWIKERRLGRGNFGIVWLEQCIQGDTKGEKRAVKQVQKLQASDYYRELEAIALFSHTRYEHCFVKSFGWYDDDDSVYITMEYFPYGDLHKYLITPLSEKEGQQIAVQILEGLQFMHENGFAHRDLKPANILVVSKGPDWWVKIGDFGISKRATEGLTALRTQTGTPAYAAPEVLGYFHSDDTSNDSYTNAVDIWSLGVVMFFILTGKALFEDQRRLGQYVAGKFAFPLNILLASKVSEQGCDFIRSLLASKSEDRPRVNQCLQSSWLHYPLMALKTHSDIDIPKSLPALSDHSEPEPSANWSTEYQITAHEKHKFKDVLAEKPISKSDKIITQSASESTVQNYWKLQSKLVSHSNRVDAVTFSPDGKQIASAGLDQTIRLWDSATGALRGTLKDPSNSRRVRTIAYSPNGKQIASAGDDQKIRLWDLATGELSRRWYIYSTWVKKVAFSPNGGQIATVGSGEKIWLWNWATGIIRCTLKGHLGSILGVAFSPDGKQIASAGMDGTVRLWDSATSTLRSTLNGHSGSVYTVEFSPDGEQIGSAGIDGTIRFWNSATGAPQGVFKCRSSRIHAMAFSPDGKQIVSAEKDEMKIWDLTTRKICGTLKDPSNSRRFRTIAFSPNGKQIASAGVDETVTLWELTKEAVS